MVAPCAGRVSVVSKPMVFSFPNAAANCSAGDTAAAVVVGALFGPGVFEVLVEQAARPRPAARTTETAATRPLFTDNSSMASSVLDGWRTWVSYLSGFACVELSLRLPSTGWIAQRRDPYCCGDRPGAADRRVPHVTG